MMTLNEINNKERAQNEAFKKWISDNRAFFNMPKSHQIVLSEYVAGLHREIADLESDKYRGKQ